MNSRRIVALIAFVSAAVLVSGSAAAQEKVKIRIGTHISISAHLFMQKKPEVLKNLGKTYDVEWVRFAGSGDEIAAPNEQIIPRPGASRGEP